MNKLLVLLPFFSLAASSINAQQEYLGEKVMDCHDTGETELFPGSLYSCNGDEHSCQAFLIVRASLNNDTLASISNLTSADPAKLAGINNLSNSAVLPQGEAVIVPVKCSCSGQYYQANTTYVIQTGDTYYTIAKDRYQGLSTCNALMSINSYDASELDPGQKLNVPLRCACPTKDQIKNGTKFLLTYSVIEKATTYTISRKFHVDRSSINYANKILDDETFIYPSTTILIPLKGEPRGTLISKTEKPNLSPPSAPEGRSKKSHKGLYVGVAAGGSLAIVCFILFLLFCHLRGDTRAEGFLRYRAARRKWKLPSNIRDGIAKIGQEVRIYTAEELEAATDNFNPQKKLGDFVYKGVLRGKLFAIKRISGDAVEEIKILSKIYHINVIGLHGICEHNGHFYLVYEFMENGTLKEWLRKENHVEAHNWNTRVLIALDVANGLDYLHNLTSPAYVHKHINSNNLLLNEDLRAKIANFSHSMAADRVEDSVPSPTHAPAERGYLAPEYIETGKVTSKLDVYAFGVVLLELVSGREAICVLDGKEVMLVDKILSAMEGNNKNGELLNLIDSRLQVKHPLGYVINQTELASRLVKLSLACLAQDPARRPRMDEVVSALLKIQLDVQKLDSF